MSKNTFLDKFNQAYQSDVNVDSSFKLPGSQRTVSLKPFTSGDQKDILKSLEEKNLIKAEADMDKILRKITGIEPKELLSADRHALIIKLREVTLGNKVEYTSMCTDKKCGHVHTINVDLNDYECVEAESLEEQELKVNENITFVLGYATRADEIDLANYLKFTSAKGKKEKEEGSYSSTELRFGTYAIIIKKVVFGTGEEAEIVVPRFQDKLEMISQLSMDDSEKIVEYIKSQKAFGFDIELSNVECPSCGNIYDDSVEWVSLFIK